MYYCKTRISQLLLLLILAATLSCESDKKPATFYPIDSLVSGQVQYLTSIRAGLFKEAFLGGKTDTITFARADTNVWKRELEIFQSLDEINKPVNKENYQVSDGLFDPGSNLTVKAFESRKELPVVFLKIYYQGNINKPRKIEALYDEENLLFESARFLSMHFQQIDNRTVLTAYSVKGGQQMIFGDSVAFYISGKVLVD